MKRYATFLSLIVFALGGCSKPTHPTSEFSQRLSTADRLVATNHHSGFGCTIAGTEVSNLAEKIKSARKKTYGANLDWTSFHVWSLKFYSGTNLLADVPMGYGELKLEGVEYVDGTGTIETFWENVGRKANSMTNCVRC
jgi:hypothetical protein